MIFKQRQREDPRLELTSLVDVLFLLIIFFTVTTTFATSGGIDVNLPQATSRLQLEKVEKLFVIINKQGDAYIEGERMSDGQLKSRLKKLAETSDDALVIIEADQGTFHGRVVAVMDMAQGAGLKRLAIATEQKPFEKTPSGEEGKGPKPIETKDPDELKKDEGNKERIE